MKNNNNRDDISIVNFFWLKKFDKIYIYQKIILIKKKSNDGHHN